MFWTNKLINMPPNDHLSYQGPEYWEIYLRSLGAKRPKGTDALRSMLEMVCVEHIDWYCLGVWETSLKSWGYFPRSLLLLLCPERRPWACQPGLHAGPGWRLFRKGLRNLRARRPARVRWGPLVGATDLRGSGGARRAGLLGQAGVQGPGPTCKGDGQTRQGQLVHSHRQPVLTPTHSSNLPHT